MGAEALCRGAAEAVGIEKLSAACEIVRQNWQKVARSEQRLEVIKGDVVQTLERGLVGAPFDLIYFDPPYAGGLYEPVLGLLSKCLSDQGEAAVEYSEAHWRPDRLPASLEVIKQKRYGGTHLVFLRRA